MRFFLLGVYGRNPLLLAAVIILGSEQKGKNSIKLTWLPCKDAPGYEVYWLYCGGKKNYKKAKTIRASGKRAFAYKEDNKCLNSLNTL